MYFWIAGIYAATVPVVYLLIVKFDRGDLFSPDDGNAPEGPWVLLGCAMLWLPIVVAGGGTCVVIMILTGVHWAVCLPYRVARKAIHGR